MAPREDPFVLQPSHLRGWRSDKRSAIAHLGELAIAAYEEPWTFGLRAFDTGYTTTRHISVAGAEAKIAISGDIAVITPVGTAGWRDVVDDIMSIFFGEWPEVIPGKVGRGYLRQAKRLSTSVVYHLEDILDRDPKIFVAAHSLGAPVASILTGYLLKVGIKPEMVVSLNSPRPGDPKFARWVEHLPNFHQVFNARHGVLDLVARVWLRRSGFRHPFEDLTTDRTLVLTSGGFVERKLLKEWRRLDPVSRLRGFRILSRLRWSIRNHGGRQLVIGLLRAATEGSWWWGSKP